MHYIMNTRTKKAKAKTKTKTKTKTKQSNYKKRSLKRQQRKTRKVGGYNHFVSPYPHPIPPEVRPPTTPAEAFSVAHAKPHSSTLNSLTSLMNNQEMLRWGENNENKFNGNKDKGIFELFKELLNNCKNHYYQQNDTDHTMFKRFFKRDKMKNIDNICDSNKPTECIDNNDNNMNQYIQLRDFIKNNTQKGKRAQFQRICKYIEQLELNQEFYRGDYHNESLQKFKKKLIHYISSQGILSNINRMSLYTLLMKYKKFANEIESSGNSPLIPDYYGM